MQTESALLGGLGSIKVTRLRDEVLARLRTAIIAGHLQPDQRLIEDDLARELGVSRSPVREALALLAREGLATTADTRGMFVRRFTAREVHELFSLRAAFETLAAEAALPRLGEADLAAMERLLEMQQVAHDGGDIHTSVELDLRFHEVVFRVADHSLLLRHWNSIKGQLLLLFSIRQRAARARHPDPYLAQRSHDHLLEALRRRELAAVAEFHRTFNTQLAEQVGALVEQTDPGRVGRDND